MDLPDLAASTPTWLALLTVLVNAVVGALRGVLDERRRWDVVGVTTFGLLMGLGGGFVRDLLIGNLPAESLRGPWFLITVLVGVTLASLWGRRLVRARVVMGVLDALALGLFAVVGVAYALEAGLPSVSAVLIGTLSAVGGGVLVSVLQGEVPGILMAGAPKALLAVAGSAAHVLVAPWNPAVASLVGIATVLALQWAALRRGWTTRPIGAGRD